jgi:hypothetical protein
MLSKLLDLLEENQGEMDLDSLSRQLDAQPSAVAGMFQLLIQKGRVVEIGPDCGPCNTCKLDSQCTLSVRRSKRYQLSEPKALQCCLPNENDTLVDGVTKSMEHSSEPEQTSVATKA